MSKNKQIIKPESGLRLKEILSITGTSQADLQRILEEKGETLSQQTISKIINGKAPLSMYNAARIANLFPEYDNLYAWLTVQSDYKTKAEKIIAGLTAAEYSGDMMLTGFSCLAKRAGYDVQILNNGKTSDGTEKGHRLFNLLGAKYIISKDGEKIAEMGLNEMQDLQAITFDAFKSILDNYLSSRKDLLKLKDIEQIIDPDLEKSEVRYNLETGKAQIYARNQKDFWKAVESLEESGFLK